MPEPRQLIENREELVSHGDTAVREPLLDVAAHAVSAVAPPQLLEGTVETVDGSLVVAGDTYDLTAYDDVYLLGAGKGAFALAEAVAARLGEQLTDGLVVDKHGQAGRIPGLTVLEAGHPLPDAASREAGETLLEFTDKIDSDDLVIACITGGASALLAAPAPGISLEDVAATTDALLSAGAPIEDLNAVRKHLSRLKGGLLARRLDHTVLVGLIVVDEVAGEPWGPTAPDPTSFTDALAVLERYDLTETIPAAVYRYLTAGVDGDAPETPTEPELSGVTNVVLADSRDLCAAAANRAAELDMQPVVLSAVMEGESRDVGIALAGIIREIVAAQQPVEPPCLLITGGETTVTLDGDAGEGGPNQELALAVATKINGLEDVGCVALGTDGTDGPTEIAGGIVDGTTMERAHREGIDIQHELARHNAGAVLRTLDDAVYTGATGTNLMDLRLLLVRE